MPGIVPDSDWRKASAISTFERSRCARRNQRKAELPRRAFLGIPSAGADAGHGSDHLRHGIEHDLLDASRLAIDQIQAGADFHLARDTDLPFIARRQEFGADQRKQHQTGGERDARS